MKIFGKIFLYILIAAFVLFAGYVGLIFTVFSSGQKFYFPLIIVGGIVLLIILFLQVFQILKSKKMMLYTWISFFAAILMSCSIYEGKQAYDKSLKIAEGNGNLYEYIPFETKSKAATLEEQSTLTLTKDLPLLDGATALYPLYATFAQATYPRKEYLPYKSESEVKCSNTIHAYKLLTERKVDLIFVASPSKQQLEEVQAAGVELRFTPIGKEAFVFFVNSHNPVKELTIEQIQAIYSGKITNWKELGGNNEPIRPFQRNEGSGSQTAFLKYMNGQDVITPEEEDVVGGMGGIISQTADYRNHRNAIGFSFRFYTQGMIKNQDVRLLKINGIFPSLESIKDGTYPLSSSFYAITLTDNDKPNVHKLINWIISEQGQYLVEKTGYCPIK